jgi:hypothetical protein
MHLALSPILLGEGDHAFTRTNLPKLRFALVETVIGERATQVILKRRDRNRR